MAPPTNRVRSGALALLNGIELKGLAANKQTGHAEFCLMHLRERAPQIVFREAAPGLIAKPGDLWWGRKQAWANIREDTTSAG